MKNFKDALNKVRETVFPVTVRGRIQQKEQIILKNDLTTALMQDLEAAGIEVYSVQKGFVILLPNDEEGVIPVELTIVTKPLDDDYDALHTEHIEKLNKE